MSTAELIEAIKALPPEKQREVEVFVQGLVEPRKKMSFDEAVEKVFSQNAELFRRLADS